METVRIYKKGSETHAYRDQRIKRGYHGRFTKQYMFTHDEQISLLVGVITGLFLLVLYLISK